MTAAAVGMLSSRENGCYHYGRRLSIIYSIMPSIILLSSLSRKNHGL